MPPRTSSHHLYAHNTSIGGPQEFTPPKSKPINFLLFVGITLIVVPALILTVLALNIIFQPTGTQILSHWAIILGFTNLVLLTIGAVTVLSLSVPIPQDDLDAKALNNRLRG